MMDGYNRSAWMDRWWQILYSLAQNSASLIDSYQKLAHKTKRMQSFPLWVAKKIKRWEMVITFLVWRQIHQVGFGSFSLRLEFFGAKPKNTGCETSLLKLAGFSTWCCIIHQFWLTHSDKNAQITPNGSGLNQTEP